MAQWKTVSNILAENPIATNGQAANKANRPTGTQPYGPYAPGEKRQTHLRARRRDEKENYSRCRKASSHGLRSKEQYSSSGPGKGCKPRKIMVRTTWGLSNCAVHEATVNLAEAYSLLKLLSFPPKHTLPPTLAGTRGTEESGLCTGGASREPHAQKKLYKMAKRPAATRPRGRDEGDTCREQRHGQRHSRHEAELHGDITATEPKPRFPPRQCTGKGERKANPHGQRPGGICPAAFPLGEQGKGRWATTSQKRAKKIHESHCNSYPCSQGERRWARSWRHRLKNKLLVWKE